MKLILFLTIIVNVTSSLISYQMYYPIIPENGCNNMAINISIPPIPKVNITVPPLPDVNITIPNIPNIPDIPNIPNIPDIPDIPDFNITCNTTAINRHNHSYPHNCILFNSSKPMLRGTLP